LPATALPKPPRLDTTNTRRSSGSPMKLSPLSTNPHRGSNSSPRKTSASNTPTIASALCRPQYVDSEMQTDPDENDPHYVPPRPPRRIAFVPLTRRLLKRCHEDRLRLEGLSRQHDPSTVQAAASAPPPKSDLSIDEELSPRQRHDDIEMKDADTAEMAKAQPLVNKSSPDPAEPTLAAKQSLSDSALQSPSPPWPSTAAHNMPAPSKTANGVRSDLRVQLPPPQFTSVPLLANNTPNTPTPSCLQSPVTLKSTASQLGLQTPGSSVVAPSPAKKKLSLGDYMSRCGTLTTPTAEKSQSQAISIQTSPATQQTINSPGISIQTHFSFGKPHGEEPKRESPVVQDVFMKDVPYSPTSPHADAPSGQYTSGLSRDPRLQPRS
jgi:hypothetical protein